MICVQFLGICWVRWFKTIKDDSIRYVVSLLDEKITVLHIRNTSNLKLFLQFVFKFWKFLSLGKFKTLENEKATHAVRYFEESCSILLQKYFKSDPDESEIKSLNSTFLMHCSEFFETFPSLEDRKPSTANECVRWSINTKEFGKKSWEFLTVSLS